jgi:tetratricopeptide (TPR) repeat protein
MTKKLASVLADHLNRGDEALAALTEFADQGHSEVRAAYVELGDRLGWNGIVAQKLIEWWFEAKHSPDRIDALRGAFERFLLVGRDQDAARVAIEIVRSKGADRELSHRLEELAVKTADHDALSVAHDLLAQGTTGPERALELVRQAEARVRAGMPASEAIQHGEEGLTSVVASDAEALLDRLAALAPKPNDVVDLYERQVSRSRAPADRVRALGRAAQVAAARGQIDRARGFFELGLTGSPTEDTLATLEALARDGDAQGSGEKLRRALSQAMAAGGQGARDGGRTRGSLLRRAAAMVHRDLGDVDQAFAWLGDALVAHVDAATLDALEALAVEIHDPARTETAITHALTDVFDGPLVRQLLARRAKIRRELLDDRPGAATDLKKLHDLSPQDQALMHDLSSLLTELGDYRGLVQLYEDQILRGKDMNARADLARKVARMWEEQLEDPREAADAWRRVLRMRQGDPEATAGLERAKSRMLKKPDPGARDSYAPPRVEQPHDDVDLSAPTQTHLPSQVAPEETEPSSVTVETETPARAAAPADTGAHPVKGTFADSGTFPGETGLGAGRQALAGPASALTKRYGEDAGTVGATSGPLSRPTAHDEDDLASTGELPGDSLESTFTQSRRSADVEAAPTHHGGDAPGDAAEVEGGPKVRGKKREEADQESDGSITRTMPPTRS